MSEMIYSFSMYLKLVKYLLYKIVLKISFINKSFDFVNLVVRFAVCTILIHKFVYECDLMKLMSPLVEASWEETGFLSFISGSMAFASCLPNSTLKIQIKENSNYQENHKSSCLKLSVEISGFFCHSDFT